MVEKSMEDTKHDKFVEMEKLDLATIIPGHGAPTNDKADVSDFREYLQELMEAVGKELSKGTAPEQMSQAVKLPRIENWGNYEDWFPINIEAACRQLS